MSWLDGLLEDMVEKISDSICDGLDRIQEKLDETDKKVNRFLDGLSEESNVTFLEKKQRELVPGDIIAVSRALPYQHFGVYIGNNKVIHFAAPNGDWGGEPTIHEAPFENFLRDSKEFEILEFGEKRSEPGRSKGVLPKDSAVTGSSFVGNPTLRELLSETYKDLQYHLYTPEETVQRAKEVAEKCAQEGSPFEVFINGHTYNLLLNNCEHFAIWCKTGVHESRQVEKVLNGVRRLISY